MRRPWWMVLGAAGLLAAGTMAGPVWAQTEGDQNETAEEGTAEDLDEEASTPAGAQRVTERLATEFNVDSQVVTDLRGEDLGFGEIHHALSLAEQLPGGATQENIDQIMNMRQDDGMGWGQIAQELDTKLGNVTRQGGPESTTGAAESLVRPGQSESSTSHGRGWGRGGINAGGIERAGGGLGHGGGPSHGGGVGAGGGGGKSSSAPGHNR